MSLDGNNCVCFFTGRYDPKLELSQEVMKFQKLFPNPSNGLRDTDGTRNLVTISLILNFHLDLKVILVKHALCTSSNGTLRLFQVI